MHMTTAKQEIAIARAELGRWLGIASAHPTWRSPHVHIRGIKAYLKYLQTQPPDKPSLYSNKRLTYWRGSN